MAEDRLALLCGQNHLTGIDFVSVENPADQKVLRVYFFKDPPALDEDGWVDDPTPLSILRIWSPSGGRSVAEPEIIQAQWVTLVGARTYLKITVNEPGDFSRYRLSIDHERVDYYFSQVDFSFKQACPTTLDCKLGTADEDCPAPEDGFELNPLARDFVSLRRALFDQAVQRYPNWTSRSDADVGVMMLELMAALGDEFNYIKDRLARETVLDELSQRRSLRQLVRLLDYELHDGRNPSTMLELDVAPLITTIDAGTPVWAHRFGEAPTTFEIGEGIADYRTGDLGVARTFSVHEDWNTLEVHEPDGAEPKLAKGATELYIVGHVGTDDWSAQQRTIVLHEDPSDGSPAKRHLVHVTEVEELSDALAEVDITRIAWAASEALPCAMAIADMTIKANVVPATAGDSFEEFFWIRGDGTHPDAVERQGPYDSATATRPPLFRHSPARCEALGLGWLGELATSVPEIELHSVEVGGESLERQWTWRRTLLDSTPDDTHFTLEDGTWRRIIGYRKPDGAEIVHRDWAANAGYTLRFGDSEFGQIPADETLFRVRYRSGPGAAANVAAGTIVHVNHPVDTSIPLNTDLLAVNNPFDVTDGLDPEDMQRAKFLAPEAFRQDTLNAVTPDDYRRLAETLDWVQQANATFRWTGSWLTIFVAANPIGAFAMTAEQHAELEDLMDSVRQVGRDVLVVQPDYVDLDLRITLCVSPGAYAGQVEAAVLDVLTGEGGFFDPDKFTFGTSLRRSALEAAIQSVRGVRAVEEIRLRAREKTGWIDLTAVAFQVGAEQIIRVVNNPSLPELGTVVVTVSERV